MAESLFNRPISHASIIAGFNTRVLLHRRGRSIVCWAAGVGATWNPSQIAYIVSMSYRNLADVPTFISAKTYASSLR